MTPKERTARSVAQEIAPATLVNLGIGLPSRAASYVPAQAGVLFQSDNGAIGLWARPPEGMEETDLTDAVGGFVTAVPGAAAIDSAMSFGLIRGGHIDLTVLGSLQVDGTGMIADWIVPGKMVPGMAGAMELATDARRVVVAMRHVANGASKVVRRRTLPLTSNRPIDQLVTDIAVFGVPSSHLVLKEIAPDLKIDDLAGATEASFETAEELVTMA